jgi:hypothetical protein
MGAAILASVPPAFQAIVAPAVPAMVEGIHGAFSLAVGQTFWLGVFGAIVATVAAVAIKEIPLRTSNEQPVYGEAPAAAGLAPKPVAEGIARSASQPTAD